MRVYYIHLIIIRRTTAISYYTVITYNNNIIIIITSGQSPSDRRTAVLFGFLSIKKKKKNYDNDNARARSPPPSKTMSRKPAVCPRLPSAGHVVILRTFIFTPGPVTAVIYYVLNGEVFSMIFLTFLPFRNRNQKDYNYYNCY